MSDTVDRSMLILDAQNLASAQIDKVAKSLGTLESTGEKVLGKLANVGKGLAAAFAVKSIFDNIQNAISSAVKTANVAEDFGITLDLFKQLRYESEKAGDDISMVEMNLRTFSAAVTEAHDETSKAARTFAAMGISIRNENGELKDLSDLLLEVGQRISTYSSGAERTNLLQSLFGRNPIDFAEALAKVATSAGQTKEELAGYSKAMDIGQAREYYANIVKIQYAYEGVWKTLAAELLPNMAKLSTGFVDAMNKAGDFQLVGQGIAVVFKVVATAATLVYQYLKFVYQEIGVLASAAEQMMSGNFRNAWYMLSQETFDTAGSNYEDTIAKMKALWGGVEGSAKAAVDESNKQRAPVIPDSDKGAKDVANEFQSTNAEAIIIAREKSLMFSQGMLEITRESYEMGKLTTAEYLKQLESHYRMIKADQDELIEAKKIDATLRSKNEAELSAMQDKIDLERQRYNMEYDARKREIRDERQKQTFGFGIQQGWQAMDRFKNMAGVAAQTLTGTLQPAIDGISSGIMGMINGTKTWGQTFLEVGSQILSTIISIIVQLAVMSALSSVFGFPFLGAVGGIFGGAKMADGGVVPGAPSYKDNQIVALASGEFVVPTRVVERWGVDHFQSYLDGRYASGGIVGGSNKIYSGPKGAGPGAQAITVVFAGDRKAFNDAMRRDGVKVAVDYLTKRSNTINT